MGVATSAMIFFVILTIIFNLQSVPALPQQKQRSQICTDYECFAKLKNANQLDARCRKIAFYTNLCYCCGGYKRYVEFGQICRRFCLYEQNLSGTRDEIETC